MREKNVSLCRLVCLWVVALLCSVVVFGPPVVEAAVMYSFDFEDGVVGASYNHDILETEPTGLLTDFSVENSLARSGTKGFTFCYGWFNLSYSKSEFLTNFSLWLHMVAPTNICYLYFYNSTLGDAAHPIIWVRINTTRALTYHNGVLGYRTVATVPLATWTLLSFSIDDELGTVTYAVGSTNVHGVAYNSTSISNDVRIDRIKVMLNNILNPYCDDVNFTLSSSYAGQNVPLQYCGNDMSGYIQIGDIFNGGITRSVNAPEFMKYYRVPLTTVIRGVALRVGSDQYDDDPVLANYRCEVNGQSLGAPDCFSQAYNGYDYILFWPCTVTVENETVALTFNHSLVSSSTPGRYWMIGSDDNGVDLDGDGYAEYVYSDSFTDCGWSYLGGIVWWWVCSDYVDEQTVSADVCTAMWVDSLTSPQVFDYGDTIGLHSWDYKNSTGYVYTTVKPVILSYTLGSAAFSYTITVTRNGSAYSDNVFPFSGSYPGGSTGLVPLGPGTYRFTLTSTHPVANVTAYVLGSFNNFAVYTSPPITNQFSSYNVVYRYQHPQGFTGSAVMTDDKENIGVYSAALFTTQVENSTGSFMYQSLGDSAEYWSLYALNGALHVSVGPIHTHYIRLPGLTSNSLYAQWSAGAIEEGNPGGSTIWIHGQHIFPGTDIAVYVNGLYAASVGDNQNYDVWYTPSSPGVYVCELRLNGNVSAASVVLASSTVTIPSSGGPGDDDGGQSLADIIPSEYHIYVGVGIVIGFVLLPFMVISRVVAGMKNSRGVTLNVPSSVFTVSGTICGVLGFCIDLYLGFFAWWTVFILIFVLALVAVIMYLMKKGASE